MKLNEFEEKLRAISDEKLKALFVKSKRNGPEEAIPLILSEAGRRGLEEKDLANEAMERTVLEDGRERLGAEDMASKLRDSTFIRESLAEPENPALVRAILVLLTLGGLLGFLYKRLFRR